MHRCGQVIAGQQGYLGCDCCETDFR